MVRKGIKIKRKSTQKGARKKSSKVSRASRASKASGMGRKQERVKGELYKSELKEFKGLSENLDENLCNECHKPFSGLPFTCKFCGLDFCDEHRLPEDHSCEVLKLRKESFRKKLSEGKTKLMYEPRVKKEIKVKFRDRIEKPTYEYKSLSHASDITSTLFKSPIAIIGIIIAIITLLLFLASLF